MNIQASTRDLAGVEQTILNIPIVKMDFFYGLKHNILNIYGGVIENNY